MSLADHVKSTKNRELLERFAFQKLESEWPKLKKELKHSIELCLDSAIDSALEAYSNKGWKVSSTNIAEINVVAWKNLKQSVSKCMRGAQIDPEEALNEMFETRGSIMPETTVEGLMTERDHEALRDKYLSAWNN
jgi:hypothetical protein